jgi:hypothetical protein
MNLLYKVKILFLACFCTIISSCLDYDEPEKGGFTPEAQVFVDRMLAENNTDDYTVDIITVGVSDGMAGISPIGYLLGVKVDSVIVLTNTIDNLRLNGIYKESRRKYHGAGGGMKELPFMGITIKCDTLDSIKIVTDSVLKMPSLGLGSCNLMYLPTLIGKLKVNALDLNDNHLKELPFEVMSIFDHLPQDNGKINVSDNPISQNYWDSVPDTLQKWLKKHDSF